MKRIENKKNLRQTAGFSLVELIVVLAVGAILVVTAVPNLTEYVDNQRIIAASNDVIAQVNRARSEAMKRNEMVVWCSANVVVNSPLSKTCVNRRLWTAGSIMYVQARSDTDFSLPTKAAWSASNTDMEMVHVTEKRSGGNMRIMVSALARYGVGFAPDGSVIAFDGSGGHIDDLAMLGESIAFAVCDERLNSSGRVVQISHTGRARILKVDDPAASTNCNAN